MHKMASHSASRNRMPNRNFERQILNRAYYERASNNFDDCDEDESESTLSTWKSVAIAVIVIGCFASVYPKVVHPILMYALGHREESNKVVLNSETFPHPSMRHGGGHPVYPGLGRSDHSGSSLSSQRMSGRTPGMGGPSQFAAQETNRGGGAWHWLLPIYTIGIVGFLLYTLSKVLWKRPQLNARHRYNMRYNPSRDRFEASCPGMETDEEEEEKTDDEENSMFPDGDHGAESFENFNGTHEFGISELHSLQNRLRETENAMHHILSQLQGLSSTTDPSQVEHVKQTAAAALSDLTKATGHKEKNSKGPLEKLVVKAHKKVLAEEQSKGNHLKLQNFDEEPYIDDLEKALNDFKLISENYVPEKSVKPTPVQEIATLSLKEKSEDGFDVMESDQVGMDAVSIEHGESETIPIKSDVKAESNLTHADENDATPKENRVRHRKRQKKSKS